MGDETKREDNFDTFRIILAKADGDSEGPFNQTAQPSMESEEGSFGDHGELVAPYKPASLIRVAETSNSLRASLDAYAVNIDGQGFRIVGGIDLTSTTANNEVEKAIYAERVFEWLDQFPNGQNEEGETVEFPPIPTEAEVEEARERIESIMRIEKMRAQSFFESCTSSKESFVSLRKKTRYDLEVTGNAYWEILRDKLGRIAQIRRANVMQTRLAEETETTAPDTLYKVISAIKYDTVTVNRKFRRYIMNIGDREVWFKELGDPRIISRETGKMFDDLESFEAAKSERELTENDQPGNELLHFNIYSPRTEYGIPRWIGVLLEAVGSRAAGEVNYEYFHGKSIPPMIMTVSGGQLAKGAVDKIERIINENIKGIENFHRIMVVEAVSGRPEPGVTHPTVPSIEMHPLSNILQSDALFQDYDERNGEKIGATFRLPPIIRGIMKDVNRANADASLRFAEDQVFAPERLDFDVAMNNMFMRPLGFSTVKFQSLGVKVSDPAVVGELLAKMTTGAIVTPDEARAKLAETIGQDLEPIGEWWSEQPLEISKLGIVPEGEKIEPETDSTGGDASSDDDIANDVQKTLDRLSTLTQKVKVRGLKALEDDGFTKLAEDAGLKILVSDEELFEKD